MSSKEQELSDQKDLEKEIKDGFYQRGLGLFATYCGTLTKKYNRKHHYWTVVVQREQFWEFETFGENYNEATKRGVQLSEHGIVSNLILVLR